MDNKYATQKLEELCKEMKKILNKRLEEDGYCSISDILDQLPPQQRQFAEDLGLVRSDVIGLVSSLDSDFSFVVFNGANL